MQHSEPFQYHSETSREAAISIKPKSSTARARVLAAIKGTAFGLTDQEIQRTLIMDQNTERPRRRELQVAGLIKDSGQTRRTSSGRRAVVWVSS